MRRAPRALMRRFPARIHPASLKFVMASRIKKPQESPRVKLAREQYEDVWISPVTSAFTLTGWWVKSVLMDVSTMGVELTSHLAIGMSAYACQSMWRETELKGALREEEEKNEQ